MHTRLSRICDALIEAGWLVVLVVTPLFYNTLTNRVFEPDKIHLLRSIVLLMAVAWAIQIVDGLRAPAESRPALRQAIRTPLVLPTLLLLGAMTLSTALSIVPRISLLGSYVRSQGLYTFLCYVALFFMVLTHLRTHAQVRRLAYAVVVASLPIALYAVIQHYGLDPLPWGGNVRERAASNLGNAIFLSAYLIMAFFIALERLVATLGTLYAREDPPGVAAYLQVACYLFILLMQGVAILFTQSRGPWLGFAAGLYVFSLVGVWLAGRWAGDHPAAPGWLRRAARPVWLGLVALAVLGIVFVAILNAPAGPLAALRQRPYFSARRHHARHQRRHQCRPRPDLAGRHRYDAAAPSAPAKAGRQRRRAECHTPTRRLWPRIHVGSLQSLLPARAGQLRVAQRLSRPVAQ